LSSLFIYPDHPFHPGYHDSKPETEAAEGIDFPGLLIFEAFPLSIALISVEHRA